VSYMTRTEDNRRMNKMRNLVAKNDFNKGSGLHGKTEKAKRVATKQKLRTSLDDLLNDDLDLDY